MSAEGPSVLKFAAASIIIGSLYPWAGEGEKHAVQLATGVFRKVLNPLRGRDKMYRFAKAHQVVLYKFYVTSTAPSVVSQVCTFCNLYHVKQPILPVSLHRRYNSSSSTTKAKLLYEENAKRKPKKKKGKYAELLEVTESSSRNKSASVSNLSVEQLDALIDKPDISLDELYKIRDILTIGNNESLSSKKSSSKKNKSIPINEHVEEIQQEEFSITQELDNEVPCEETFEPTEEIVENNLIISKSRKKKQGHKSKKSIEDSIELEKVDPMILSNTRMNHLNLVAAAYTDVCIYSDHINDSFKTLIRNTENRKIKNTIRDIKVYNLLLKKYAEGGNYRKVQEIVKYLRDTKIPLDINSYAAMLECLGRFENCTNKKVLVQKLMKKMSESNVTLNNIFNDCFFNGEDLLFVLQAVRLVDPNFEPTIVEPEHSYSNALLTKLNCTNNALTSPATNLTTFDKLQSNITLQLSKEFDGLTTVKTVEKINEKSNKLRNAREKVARLEEHWLEIATKSFEKKLLSLKNREKYSRKRDYLSKITPYLTVLKPEIYVDAIMKEVKNLVSGSEGYSPSLAFLHRNLGSYIFKRYEMCKMSETGMIDKITDIHSKYCDWYMNRTDGMNSRAKWETLVHEAKTKGIYINSYVPPWPSSVESKIGRFLYDIIMCDIKIDNSFLPIQSKQPVPAFCVVYKQKNQAQMKQEIRPHANLTKLYRDSKPEKLQFETSLLPSMCPPRPWLSMHSGGYLATKTNIVRVPRNSAATWKLLEQTPTQQLHPALDSLNQLGTIPWKVNTNVLDVAINIFQKGGNSKLDIPESPDSLPLVPAVSKDASSDEKTKHYRARLERRKKKNEMMSLWCDTLYKLSLANHLRDDMFWLPHNMDFRGRVYPIPPHMTHVSSDLSRSMLMFAQKKPIGPNGLDWLKIHTINLTGFKKRDSVQTKLDYANEILDTIIDSAEKPLTGSMWWTKSDEPWQTLASCMEINAAIKSGKGEHFESGFPIHQDGSCNGLQHYAALGRDVAGADSVNLRPNPLPQDVYSSVAALVEEKRAKDAENGDQVAKVLENFIARKVIKQTVMTTVYGVTKFGARLQIAKQLRDIDNFPQEHVWQASLYLVTNTFESLRSMFKSAREIQDWFTDCARKISRDHKQNVSWVTPLGLPVVQPYTKLQNVKVPYDNVLIVTQQERPNSMKQKNAFAPNFVHSLDSTHMMLTSLNCEHAGMTFVSVHDCFWTHCATVEDMNKICREQFVALHSQPILEDLSKFFVENYKSNESEKLDNEIFSKVPKKGEFDLNEVLSSVYFFS